MYKLFTEFPSNGVIKVTVASTTFIKKKKKHEGLLFGASNLKKIEKNLAT